MASTCFEHYLLILRRRYTNGTWYIACVLCQLVMSVGCTRIEAKENIKLRSTHIHTHTHTYIHIHSNVLTINLTFLREGKRVSLRGVRVVMIVCDFDYTTDIRN